MLNRPRKNQSQGFAHSSPGQVEAGRRNSLHRLALWSLLTGLTLGAGSSGEVLAQSTDCKTGSSSWVTTPMTPQTGSFTVSFDATPSNSTSDAVIGLSKGSASGWTKYAALVRFNIKSTIDARSGNSYVADNNISYTGGKTYRVRMVVDIPGKSYSAYVTPPGQVEQVIGENLAFRTDQKNVADLDHWGFCATAGSVTVCNFAEGDAAEPPAGDCSTASIEWQPNATEPLTGPFSASFNAVPRHAAVDGLVGLSKGAGTWFTDFAMLVRFNVNNTIDVRNGSTFAARTVVGYQPNTKYRFRVEGDVATGKYDVYVTPAGGQEIQLAAGYSFRTEQQGIDSVDNWSAYAGFGDMDVCDVVVETESFNQLPIAKATANPLSGPAPLTVQFDGSASSDPDGSIASYAWSFGDGQTATGATASHTYTNAGTYTATLTVTDNQGAKSTAKVSITASGTNQTPKAVATADKTSGAAPLTVNFDASGSSDPDGSIVSYAWVLGDGTTKSGAKVAHTYQQAGTYAAKVTVTDNQGATASATVNITVSATTNCVEGSPIWQTLPMGPFNDMMTAEFEVTPKAAGLDGLIGLSAMDNPWFHDLAATIRFNMANTIDARNGGTYAATNTVSYVAGTKYRIRMLVDVKARKYDAFVTPAGGAEKQIAAGYSFRTEQASVSSLGYWTPFASFGTMDVCNFLAKAVVRNEPPVASGTVTPTSGEAPLNIQVNASGCSDADGEVVAHEWDFGDGNKATTVQATHTYEAAGNYKVTLKAIDNLGAVGTKEFSVTATPPPGSCQTSAASWQSFPMTSQQGAFTVEFDATPSANYMDGGLALAKGQVSDYPDGAVAVRFNTAGLIDARSGGGYGADNNIAYSAGKTYHFRLTVSIPSHSYSVYVTPQGGTEQLVARDYSFRTEQMSVTALDTWAIWAGSDTQTHQVCNFNIGTPPPATLAVGTKMLDFGLNTTNLPFEVWNSGSGTLNYSVGTNANWLTVSPTNGSSTGQRNTITATVNRSGLAAGTYQGTITVTPSTGAAVAIAVVMQYGTVPQTKLKPIARWDTVPNQRINANSTLNVGVVAFSKYGIARVSFNVIGQGYKGTNPINVTEMSLNPQTGVYEYWTPIRAADFSTNGAFTIEATVYGNDGGVRDKSTDGGGVGLDALPLVVNATGSLPQVEAWVSPTGNDSTGVVNDSTRPFKSVGLAIDRIRAHRYAIGAGNNADGGIVRLTAGNHYNSTGGASGPVTCNEWVTITTAAGATRSNTVLLAGSMLTARKIALRGITVRGSSVLGMSYNDRTQTHVWADDCTLIGSGRGITTSHPLSSEFGRLYYTGCSITEVHQATSGSQLCRGLTITRISDDAFQNIPAIYNCVVDDVDPLSTGAHADVWQHGMGNDWNKNDHNVIVYNLKATNLKYQSLFIRADIYSPPSYAQGMAFVNVFMQMRSDSHGWGGWYRWTDHLLWWHCTYTVKGMGIMPDTYAGVKRDCSIKNMSVKGCDFAFLGIGGSDANVDFSDWSNNHFVDGSTVRGTNVTTGANRLDSYGVPLSDSPLLDRLSPVVPVDVRNKLRTGQADVGAFER